MNNPSTPTFQGATMNTRILTSAVLLALAPVLLVSASCSEQRGEVNRVQTNLVDKSLFEGDWWYTRTVIDMPDDAAWAVDDSGMSWFAPWTGAIANFDIASQSGVIGRIRWVIDENILYAYRASELIPGSNPDAREEEFRGSPLAAYRITSHVDVRREFNPATGERTNVLSENTSDRRWYDRQFIRVDWSQNLVTFGQFGASLELDQVYGTFRREAANLHIADEGTTGLPAAWVPQFVTVGEDPDYRFRTEWPAGTENTVHYMSFVTQEMWTPMGCNGGACGTSLSITLRDAFLRIPPNHNYAIEALSNSEYDRFGIIRAEQRTYLRGGEARAALGQFCRVNEDCETGACDVETAETAVTNVCVGGISDELGDTDYLTYYRLRHNFYENSLTDIECVTDWQCSNRYGSGTGVRATGSVCDQYARRCTIPVHERTVRPVHYTMSPEYPTFLIPSAFEVVAGWNETFMLGNRSLPPAPGETLRPLPGGEPVDCQSANPTQYCFCGDSISAPEVDPATRQCPFRLNFFLPPGTRGVTSGEDYDCWVAAGAPGAEVPFTHPDGATDFGDYAATAASQLHFVGTECMLVLDVNSCDRDPSAACEQLGDIRYNFFNYIEADTTQFCGVMQHGMDPSTGEAVLSPVNMAGWCVNQQGTAPLETWPRLRGEATPDDIFTGDEIRRYFEATGNVRPPRGIAPGPTAGYSVDDPSRPALPTDLAASFRERLEELRPDLQRLQGTEGRARILSDRMQSVDRTAEGRELMRRFAAATAAEGFPTATRAEQEAADRMGAAAAMHGALDVDDPHSLARVSPFADGFVENTLGARDREYESLGRAGCMLPPMPEYTLTSQYGQYWAEAFRGVDNRTARIQWVQAYHRDVMMHELGHGLGLQHNFASSLDRDNYPSEWYRFALENPLPEMEEFDEVANGGNGDGVVTADETDRFYEELARVRRVRQLGGLGNYGASSVMEYAGDLSGTMGLAPYDRGAVLYNYFNQVEAYQGDPRHSAPGTSQHDMLRPDITPRQAWSWYRGGESCDADTDCPMAAGSPALPGSQVVAQRCVTNPRFSTIQQACDGNEHCICSSFDQDFTDYQNGIAYREFSDPLEYYPVVYLFCDNSRLNDISWCTVFDAGESFQESVANWRRAWEYGYPYSYFRRHRRSFGQPNRLYSISDAAKVFQHLFFRYFNNEINRGRTLRATRFSSDPLPLGFNDQYLASIDAMNWLGQIASLPDVGSYEFNAATNSYRHMGEEYDMPGSDITLEVGQGYYTWSRYQEGLLGFFRTERRGTFWDKLFALQALTLRDWGGGTGSEERYYVNFHSVFPIEVTELFGGYILDDATWFAPRIDNSGAEPVVEYPTWYRGGECRIGPRPAPCRGSNASEYTNPVIEGTSNDILRFYAVAFALSEFPVFYDTSWESRLAVFQMGSGDQFTMPDGQPDGTRTCAYRTPREEAEATTTVTLTASAATCLDVEDADYITYTSDRLHSTYVAVKVRSRTTYNLEEEQLGFALLRGLSQQQDRIRELVDLEAGRPLTAAEREELTLRRNRLESEESFLQNLVALQRVIGINSYL